MVKVITQQALEGVVGLRADRATSLQYRNMMAAIKQLTGGGPSAVEDAAMDFAATYGAVMFALGVEAARCHPDGFLVEGATWAGSYFKWFYPADKVTV